jgi:RNAse (barnase) inhibitor barstar
MFSKATLGLLATYSTILLSNKAMAAGKVVINGKEIKSQEALNSLLVKDLNFPKFYNKSFDSLYDVLSTDFAGNTEIKIKHLSFLRSKLGPDYVEALLQTINEASTDNPKIILLVE